MPVTEVQPTETALIVVGVCFLITFFLIVFFFARWTIYSQSEFDNSDKTI